MRNHFTFGLVILIGAFVWTQLIIYWLHEFMGFNPRWGMLQYCISALREQTAIHQFVFFCLNILIAYCVVKFLWVFIHQMVLVSRWTKNINSKRHKILTMQIRSRFKEFGSKIIVIDQVSIVALTYGFFRPRIVISTSLIEHFSDRELAALLWHENHHCRNQDPLRTLILKMINESLPFIPIIKRLSRYIEVWMELLADQYSIRKMRTSHDLASVLLKCSKLTQKMPIGVGFADVAINYRIQQLVQPDHKVRVPFVESLPMMYSIMMITLLTGIVVSGCS